tara:strand:+ start:3406 stop:3693 length:288 start_codon:yes stop_codon:yes gene_type:complete
MSAQTIFTPIGAATAAGANSGAAADLVGASHVLVTNTADAGTEYLVTIEIAGTAGVKGSFYIAGQESTIIRKDPLDQMFAANALVFFTKVSVFNG